MRVEMQRCVLILWLCALATVEGRDCTLAEFIRSDEYNSNFDLTGLSESYTGGKSVRVPCNVGFVGFFKMICTEEGWIYRGQECEARSCGHPGDAPYAEFELSKGDDFVFGSEVVYTCNRGFQMVSRNIYRRCMAEGWDGVIPVCEAIRCPAIYTDDETQVTGDTEDATFGNVLRFSCRSNRILNGSAEMFCNEFGEWSTQPPNCIKLECTRPVIENGRVRGNAQSYMEDELLSYSCDPKYRPVNSMSPKCTKTGERGEWSPTPQCEAVKCKLTVPPTRGTTYEPVGKSLFYPGERVTVTCEERYFIVFHKDISKEITCQDNGRWDSSSTTCDEVFCDRPRDVNINNLYYWQRKRLHETQTYSCKNGFRIPMGYTEATCTRDGWTPDPLCVEITCFKEHIEHAVYRSQKTKFKNGDHVVIECQGDYGGEHTMTCRRDGWDRIPTCQARTCSSPSGSQDVINFKSHEWRKNIHETKKYTCRRGYKPKDGVDHATCTRDGWVPKPLCEEGTTCSKPSIRNGFAVGPLKNDKFYFTCDENYKLSSKGWWGETSCDEGVWSHSTVCIGRKQCVDPAIPHAKQMSSPRDYYENEETIQVECEEGYTPEIDVIKCEEGKWDSRRKPLTGLCSLTALQCNPPARVANAVVDIKYRKKYLSNTKVTYICRDGYRIEGDDSITCRDGTWETKNITCIRYCKKPEVDERAMTVNNEKDAYQIGDVIEYECVVRSVKSGGNARCVDGKWDEPVECKESCRIHKFDTELHLKNLLEEVTMGSGTSKRIECISPYRQYNPGNHFTRDSEVMCNNGVISYQESVCCEYWCLLLMKNHPNRIQNTYFPHSRILGGK